MELQSPLNITSKLLLLSRRTGLRSHNSMSKGSEIIFRHPSPWRVSDALTHVQATCEW